MIIFFKFLCILFDSFVNCSEYLYKVMAIVVNIYDSYGLVMLVMALVMALIMLVMALVMLVMA